MGSHSVTCHPAEVTFLPLPPTKAGTRFSDPRGMAWMQGWVDLGDWLEIVKYKLYAHMCRMHGNQFTKTS